MIKTTPETGNYRDITRIVIYNKFRMESISLFVDR
jgi:hypothetical protein